MSTTVESARGRQAYSEEGWKDSQRQIVARWHFDGCPMPADFMGSLILATALGWVKSWEESERK